MGPGCKLPGCPPAASHLILQPADPDTESLSQPYASPASRPWVRSPAPDGAVASCPTAAPSKARSGAGLPSRCLGEQAETPVSVRWPRSILFVWSSHSAPSQAIFRRISRVRQLFLQEESGQKPWQRGRRRHGQSAARLSIRGVVIGALSAAMLVGFHPSKVRQQRTSDAALPIHGKAQQLQKGSGEPGSPLTGHRAAVAQEGEAI